MTWTAYIVFTLGALLGAVTGAVLFRLVLGRRG